MSQETTKKIGVFTALTMMIGSIVGVGIFFKSGGVLSSNNWNGIGTFLSWVIGGLLSLAAAISFSEIGTMKIKRTTGLAAWSEKSAGKKTGYFVRFNYPFYYYGLLAGALGFFASESLFNVIACYGAFSMNDIPAYSHAIVGLAISVGFITLNYFSIKGSGIVQQITTVLKWIPLIAVAALGIIMATTNEMPDSANRYGHNAFTNGTSFKFTGMLAAVPAVLFAFDSFLTAPTLAKKVRGGVKKVPFIVIVGIISCLTLYLLIAVSAILHGTGYVSSTPLTGNGPVNGTGIFDQIFDGHTAKIVGQLVMVFLFISTWGVLNGITASAVVTIDQAVETETVLAASWAKKKLKNASLWYAYATYGFWFILFFIGTIITGSDAVVDGLSNFSTLFFFGIYGYVILRYTLKRNEFDSKKINSKLFKTFAWIAIIGIGFFVGYQLIYGFFINAIINPQDATGWGLFASHGKVLVLWQASIVFFSMLILFTIAPIINEWAVKKFNNKEVYIDTFK